MIQRIERNMMVWAKSIGGSTGSFLFALVVTVAFYVLGYAYPTPPFDKWAVHFLFGSALLHILAIRVLYTRKS